MLYMDALAKMLRYACPNDGYLDTLDSLALMGDTAVLATSETKFTETFDGLVKFCEECDMIINEDKTKLKDTNGTADYRSFNKGGVDC